MVFFEYNYILVLGIWYVVILCGKIYFVDVIKLKILKWRDDLIFFRWFDIIIKGKKRVI